jgi:cellulose biosynthesis protein BcsQ
VTVSIIKASDLILLTIQPSSVDLWSVGTIIDHVEARQQMAKLQARFIVSRAPATSTLTGDIEAALEDAPFGRM